MFRHAIIRFLMLLLLSGAAAIPMFARAGKHAFNVYSVENGLPNNQAQALLQDRAGFVWVGTREGLCRFDGARFHRFDTPSALSLAELPDGRIWAGTNDGIYEWDHIACSLSVVGVPAPDGTSLSGPVPCLWVGKDGGVWAASGNLLLRFDPVEKRWNGWRLDENLLPGLSLAQINDLLPDRNGTVWIASDGENLLRFDTTRNTFSSFPVRETAKRFSLQCLMELDGDTLLAGCSEGGVWLFDKRSRKARPYVDSPDGSLFVHTLLPVGNEELWIGAETGLFIFDKASGSLDRLHSDLGDPTALSDNSIYSLCEDKEGGIWVGTRLGGVCYTSTEQDFISLFTPSSGIDAFHGRVVRDILEDPDGSLWIGTEDSGIYRYDRSSGVFSNTVGNRAPLPSSPVSALFLDGRTMLAGMFHQGFCLIDTSTGRVRPFPTEAGGPEEVLSILKDSRGRTWIGTGKGLWRFYGEGSRPSFASIPDGPATPVLDIVESRSGKLWIATFGEGFWSFDPERGLWEQFRHSEKGGDSQNCDFALSVSEDNHDFLWIGTDGGGAFRFDPSEKSFTHYGTDNGLPGDTVYEIIEDKLGNIWFTTGNGLSRLSQESGAYITYSLNYGTPSNQFNYKAALKTTDGMLYFGTVKGFMEVNPDKVKTNYDPPRVVFTSYTLSGQENLLPENADSEPTISLRYNEPLTSVSFASLSYTSPQNNQYAWRLKGLDKEWTHTKNTNIQFNYIPPGRYTLEVKGANGDGIWYEKPSIIHIRVKAPFLGSTMGIILESLAALGLVILLMIQSRRRIREKNQLEIKRIKEIERNVAQKNKIEFFSSIIHEIRTPLSLIKAPFEEIKRKDLTEEEYRENVGTIDANIDRLLLLSNEILDFSRVEDNAFTVHPKRTDVKHIAEEVLTSFAYQIQENSYEIEKKLPEGPVFAWTDPEILIKILSNLLGNAVKYAESKIIFSLEAPEIGPDEAVVDGNLTFRISNDGQIISPKNREKVFQAFWREDRGETTAGTGLGLPLVKKLTELQGGKVWIDGSDTEMNTLIVELPVGKEDADAPADSAAEGLRDVSSDRRTIAVVDDDPGIRSFLQRSLSRHYNVICCKGETDLYKALDGHIIDLIISDIMMPGTDGITLCHNLKTSFENSHIPIILLTAKVGSEVKVKGLAADADAFVEKPFTMELLESLIENIFSRQNKMREYYAQDPHISSGVITENSSDQEFLDRVSGLIVDHMEEEDFSIDKIADLMNMSRSSLYRKLRGITRLAPGELISTIRLKKAAELLATGRYRVSEVCYLVGFQSVPYFSTSFRKQFNISPKDYIKKSRAAIKPSGGV
jgi:signal transduction histidine kinase/DNA-binding response OmpR family regulator/streptogramin lyase